MQFNFNEINNFDREIAPFLRNGILIDTSVLYEILDGFVQTRISKKQSPEFESILNFLDLIKLTNRWDKFFITPHILTELCRHLRSYEKSMRHSYVQIVREFVPILKEMNESHEIRKNDILSLIDLKRPVIEIGDISIFLVTDGFIQRKEKISILVKDAGVAWRYIDHPHVMVMDYRNTILNSF